jgi:hypothetical protein
LSHAKRPFENSKAVFLVQQKKNRQSRTLEKVSKGRQQKTEHKTKEQNRKPKQKRK